MGHRIFGRRGSVLILVVALLAVLFVTGMGFLAMTSIDRLTFTSAEQNTGLVVEADAAVGKVIGELSADLWGNDGLLLSGNGANEPWDFPCSNNANGGVNFGASDDAWLASTLPEASGGSWRHITNLSGRYHFGRDTLPDNLPDPNDPAKRIPNPAAAASTDSNVPANSLEADADMDGIPDSRWMLSSSGKYRVAIRVIDLNAMINLNTAGRGFCDDLGTTPYNVAACQSNVESGWWNYGSDDDFDLFYEYYERMMGRGNPPSNSPADANGAQGRVQVQPQLDFSLELDNRFLRTSGSFPSAHPFGAVDTLALMSYGIKPGPVAARVAPCWANTFATTRNLMPNITTNDPSPNANNTSFNMYYTTYGWTRQLRPGSVPTSGVLPGANWVNLINQIDPSGLGKVPINGTPDHGLTNPHDTVYTKALVAAIVLSGTSLTQQQIEQLVVNLVSWRDGTPDVSTTGGGGAADKVDTVWNSPGIYSNKPQVFITELGALLYPGAVGDGEWPKWRFALELFNPYSQPVDVSNWVIRIKSTDNGDTSEMTLPGVPTVSTPLVIPAGGRLVLRNMSTTVETNNPAWPVGGLVDCSSGGMAPANAVLTAGGEFGLCFKPHWTNADINLLRPVHSGKSGDTLLIVDKVKADDVSAGMNLADWLALPPSGSVRRHAQRGDTEWMQSRDRWATSVTETWGQPNNSGIPAGTPPPGCRDGREAMIAVPPFARLAGPPLQWVNNRQYVRGDLATQTEGGSEWFCLQDHTSASTGTFDQDRLNRSTYWKRRSLDFDTLGQLHWLMLVGPEVDTGTPVTAKITQAATGPATAALYLDFSNTSRGDYRLSNYLVRLDRRALRKYDPTHNSWVVYDWNGNGQTGPADTDELRLPGLVNINTATPRVMEFLNYWMYPADDGGWNWSSTWDAYANRMEHAAHLKPAPYVAYNQGIYNYREDSTHLGLREGSGELMKVAEMPNTAAIMGREIPTTASPAGYYGYSLWVYSARNLRAEQAFFYDSNYALPNPPMDAANSYICQQTPQNDVSEKHFIFDRISDLVTTRSDTFLAYILVQAIDRRSGANYWSNAPGDVRVLQQRRLVVILDRSRCNSPPGSANYRVPEMIGHSVPTW